MDCKYIFGRTWRICEIIIIFLLSIPRAFLFFSHFVSVYVSLALFSARAHTHTFRTPFMFGCACARVINSKTRWTKLCVYNVSVWPFFHCPNVSTHTVFTSFYNYVYYACVNIYETSVVYVITRSGEELYQYTYLWMYALSPQVGCAEKVWHTHDRQRADVKVNRFSSYRPLVCWLKRCAQDL